VVDVEEPEDAISIDLSSPVRESVSQIVQIDNPTDVEVTILATNFKNDNEFVELTPEKLVIPPRSERPFEVHYRPLLVSGE
jgi:hypothetical protein